MLLNPNHGPYPADIDPDLGRYGSLAQKRERELMRQALWDAAARYTKNNSRDLISLGEFLGLRSALFFCGDLSIHDLELS